MLLVRRTGEQDWKEPALYSYQSERALQELLLTSPGLIPGLDPERTKVADEVSLAGGAADLVAVDAEGAITIVECKLGTNPEMRRTVVGQILAYAAALSELDFEQFDAVMARRGVALSDLFSESLSEAGEAAPEQVRQQIARTLAAGDFRLVIAVDRITGELRSIIEWLNAHTSPKVAVLGLEIGHAARDGVEFVVSDVYGQETASAKQTQHGSTPRHKWTEAELFAAMESIDATLADGLRRLFRHAEGHPKRDGWYWGDGQAPSVTPWMDSPGGHTQPWSMYVGGSAGTRPLYINFDWIHRRGNGFPNEIIDAFAREVSSLPGLQRFADEARASGWAKRPGITEDILKNRTVVDGIIRAMDNLYSRVGADNHGAQGDRLSTPTDVGPASTDD